MSLLNTIAIEGTTPHRGFRLKGIGTMVAVLALGVALGFALSSIDVPGETAQASSGSLGHVEFLELNTSSYDGLVPAAAVVVADSRIAIDPFMEMNTTSYDGLVPASATNPQSVTGAFIDMNTTSFEYPAAQYSEQPAGPR